MFVLKGLMNFYLAKIHATYTTTLVNIHKLFAQNFYF